MPFFTKLRWKIIGVLGKTFLWLWAKSSRIEVLGEEEYKKLREEGKPVIFLVWHGRIFFAPYFFRRRGIMPLISPSQDGEIVAQIVARWGYRILRGSSSHSIIRAWNEMKRELLQGGELIIVPDGPRGPDRKLKPGCLKLAQETGAYLVPFTFSASRKKIFQTWDRFLLFYPFSKVVVLIGQPLAIDSGITEDELEKERQKVESLMVELDEKADGYFQ
jgi:hypothetical protein